jgi:hypothetical protein
MEEYVKDFKVREGIWDETVKIGKVKQTRHTVFFEENNGDESSITYCNNCSSPFTINDRCAHCGMEMKNDQN